MCKSNEKGSLLTLTVSSLIQLLEDADSNTRLVIDESLNKIIKVSWSGGLCDYGGDEKDNCWVFFCAKDLH